MSQLDRLHVAGDGAEQTLQDLQLGDARIQFHLRGEGEAGTAPGTVRLYWSKSQPVPDARSSA